MFYTLFLTSSCPGASGDKESRVGEVDIDDSEDALPRLRQRCHGRTRRRKEEGLSHFLF